ncbi:MAG: NUDIX domain-containing protein [Actinomycetota bacterium]|nr:NUDIX domain-containing protein [Actinomycetota bacterium]
MRDRIRLVLLRIYRALPAWARKFVVLRITPSFRVGAACIVVREDGAILLVRHSYRAGWGLPGGLIRRREEPRDAALRESREEVGLDLELTTGPTVIVDSPGRRIDVIFEARVLPDSPRQVAVAHFPEIVEVQWFQPGRLPQLQEEAAGALTDRFVV